MATPSPNRLQAFLSYLNNYLFQYRKINNTTPNTLVVLKFLSGADTINIYCQLTEPLPNVAPMKVNEFWYNGSVLRKCLSLTSGGQVGFVRSYKVCNVYEDAFSTTILSLNPELLNSDGSTTPPPTTTTPAPPATAYLPLSGNVPMQGPLILQEGEPQTPRTAVSKSYVDGLIAGFQSAINALADTSGGHTSAIGQLTSSLNEIRNEMNDKLRQVVVGHTQDEPAVTWLIEHHKGTRVALCQAFDEDGYEVYPDAKRIVDENVILISFSTPQKGSATVFLQLP